MMENYTFAEKIQRGYGLVATLTGMGIVAAGMVDNSVPIGLMGLAAMYFGRQEVNEARENANAREQIKAIKSLEKSLSDRR